MRKRYIALLTVICLTCALCGCWDSVEIDDQCFLLFLAIDGTEKGGVQLTTEIPVTSKEAQAEDSENNNMVTVAGKDIFDAVDMLYASVPLHINLSQMKIVFVSEEYARNENFLSLLDDLLSLRGLRRMASVVVCKDRAAAFVEKVQPTGDMLLSKSMEIALTAYEQSSYLVNSRLLSLSMQMHQKNGTGVTTYASLSSKYESDEPLDYYGEASGQPGDFYASDVPHRGVAPTELFGAALFDNTRMREKLTGYETQLLCFMQGKGVNNMITVPVPNEGGPGAPNSVEDIMIQPDESPSIRITGDEGGYVFSIDLPLKASLTTNKTADEERLKIFEWEAWNVLNQDSLALLKRFQSLGLDPVGFADAMTRHFVTIPEWDAFDWDGAYENAQIALNTYVTLDHPRKDPGGLPMFFR